MRKLIIIIWGVFILPMQLFSQTNKTLELHCICKAWGFLKYYHPSIQRGKINWDNCLLESLEEYDKGTSYNIIIEKWLNKLGEVNPLNRPFKYLPKDTTFNNLPLNWLKNNSHLNTFNKKKMWDIIENYKPKKNVNLKRDGYILQRKKYKFFDLKRINESHFDKYQCQLLLFKYWNIINYFYPYLNFEFTPDWDSLFLQYSPIIEKSNNFKNVYMSLAKLHTNINDGHGFYYGPYYNRQKKGYYFPIKFAIFNGEVYIKWSPTKYQESFNLTPGCIVKRINSVNVNILLDKLRQLQFGTREEVKNHLILGNNYLGYSSSDTLKIEFIDTNNKKSIAKLLHDTKFNRKAFKEFTLTQINNIPYRNINKNIGYINNHYCTKHDIHKAFRKFRKKKAIIIDTRLYGGQSAKFLGIYISNKRTFFSTGYKNDKKYPGTMIKQKHNTYPVGFGIQCLVKKYKGTIAMLMDEKNTSGNEYLIYRLKELNPGIVLIGRNTAGAISTVGNVKLPDGVFAFSKDIYLAKNGDCYQYYGYPPDIYVSKNLKSLKEGKDEIFEFAIEFLNKNF